MGAIAQYTKAVFMPYLEQVLNNILAEHVGALWSYHGQVCVHVFVLLTIHSSVCLSIWLCILVLCGYSNTICMVVLDQS